MHQDQFLTVIDRDEAERRFRAALPARSPQTEFIALSAALGRIIAQDIAAPLDVPGFDRSNMDGFAVRAADTFGAEEENLIELGLNGEEIRPGIQPGENVAHGTATAIATGSIIPRGADSVVMIEVTEILRDGIVGIRRPVAPGANITYAGTDIGMGEIILRKGEMLTSRETGVLAALGLADIPVIRRPRVAILSTGDEIIAPGQPMQPGLVYDSNGVILADAVRELGCEPIPLGIVPDNPDLLRETLTAALQYDMVLLSGGTSKGAGDISYRIVRELGPPGIVAHGVALKPGKPLCLAVIGKTPVVILPGFPTSAIFTFHEFVAPVLRQATGHRQQATSNRTESDSSTSVLSIQHSALSTFHSVLTARLPMRINSEKGRTEYLLVNLIPQPPSLQPPTPNPQPPYAAYPMGKGSGSVTTFSRADGFITIPRHREYLDEGEIVEVQLLGHGLRPAELIVIGSHCAGLDYLLGQMHELGYKTKFLAVGSTGGLHAVRRGECDIAGIHLLDPKTGEYNRPFLSEGMELIPGYGRLQGLAFRDHAKQGCHSPDEFIAQALGEAESMMVNRNPGSGTRVLIDQLLDGQRPPGYSVEAKSHNAVAAAIAQGRADWGVCIETVAKQYKLNFIPLKNEEYDFITPTSRAEREPIIEFRKLLKNDSAREKLHSMGFTNS